MRCFTNSRSWGFRLLCFGALQLASCKNDVAAQQAQPIALPASSDGASAAPARPAEVAAPAKPRFDETAFTVEMRADSPIKVGSSFGVSVSLEAKPPFHVNAEYPHRFKVGNVKGGTSSVAVVTRDPSKVEPGKLALVVPVTATQTGAGQVDGELLFSLCTADKCLMEKRRLTCAFTAN